MKQFSLDEYLKNPNKKVVTRSGIPVKIHCTNFVTTHKPVIAEIVGRGYSQSFTKEGRFYEDTYESSEDLFFAPEKHEGWVNVWEGMRSMIDTAVIQYMNLKSRLRIEVVSQPSKSNGRNKI